jgi:glycosyltransferase involved in cell wall biosynthesis
MMHTKKKVLFVRTTMGQGGADRVTSILLQYLDRKDYELSLLLMKKEGEHLSSIPNDVYVMSSVNKSLLWFLPTLLSAIKDCKPDVVFSTSGGTNVPLALCALLKFRRQYKIVLSERNMLFPPGKGKIKRALMVIAKAILYRFADRITAVSEGVRKDMQRLLYISQNRIQLVFNPVVENSMLQLANESVNHSWFKSDREIPVIVHAGRFVYQKDHYTLITAFATVRNMNACRLFLLGDGPLLESMKKLVHDLGIERDVFFAGFDLNPFKYFSKCDLFVLSSRHEGMPGTLIQAMACGAPVVSTDCPSGPNEIITESGKDGILVPVGDAVALAGAIEKVLTDKNLSASLRINAKKAVEKFRLETAIQSYRKAMQP